MRFVQAAKFQDVIDYLLSMRYVGFLGVLGNSLEPISQFGYDLHMPFCDFVFVFFQPLFLGSGEFLPLGTDILVFAELGEFQNARDEVI